MFLNEELSRLKSEINTINDEELKDKTGLINEKLNSFHATEIDDNVLLTILKTQQLVKELNDGNSN